MGYDRCGSYLFDFEPNVTPFGPESHHDHIPINLKGYGNTVISVNMVE